MDTMVIDQIRHCASIRLETEGFRFLVNLIKHSEEFLVRITHHFLESGDELFHFTKKVFSIQTLETLSDLIYSKSQNTSRFKLCQYFLQLITEMFSRMKEQFAKDVLVRCDKFAFHFTRRIGEYTLALYHYFGADLHNVYVGLPLRQILSLHKLITECLLSVLKVSSNSLAFQGHHPLMAMFRKLLDSPLCLSTNLEDEVSSEVYYNCVKVG